MKTMIKNNLSERYLCRGKRVDNNEWIEGYYVHYDDIIDNHNDDCDYIIEKHNGGNFVFHEVVPETVGEFMGLTDRNGKKVFKGDIVDYKGMPKTYMIDFHEDFLHCSLFYYDKELKNIYYSGIVHKNDGKSIEVIGNIHDNPELLQEGK